MSKVSMPRPRHIAVRIAVAGGNDPAAAHVSRRAFAASLRAAAKAAGWAEADQPQVTRYEWPHAAVRVTHEHAAAARGLLAGIVEAVEGTTRLRLAVVTLSTGGTIAALTARLGILTERTERTEHPLRALGRGAQPSAGAAGDAKRSVARPDGMTPGRDSA